MSIMPKLLTTQAGIIVGILLSMTGLLLMAIAIANDPAFNLMLMAFLCLCGGSGILATLGAHWLMQRK